MPCFTEPEPGGRPLKSGRTSMSHAASSPAVAARPMPGYDGPCAPAAATLARHSASAAARLRQLHIADLAALLNPPGLDRVVVIDRARAAHCAQLAIGRLHVAAVVD